MNVLHDKHREPDADGYYQVPANHPQVIAAVLKAGGARARKVGVHPAGNRKQRRGFKKASRKLP